MSMTSRQVVVRAVSRALIAAAITFVVVAGATMIYEEWAGVRQTVLVEAEEIDIGTVSAEARPKVEIRFRNHGPQDRRIVNFAPS
ncbi:MAG: hypothetical protein N2039_01795 [Gemmataceae bacterium]|nr:hypothetical protein [Gemmataceae bacterium]